MPQKGGFGCQRTRKMDVCAVQEQFTLFIGNKMEQIYCERKGTVSHVVRIVYMIH